MKTIGWIAAGLILTSPAMAAPQPAAIALPGNQHLVIPHVGGRTQPGTAIARPQDGSAIIATTATYQWPGTYFVAAFEGPEISVRLNDSANILTVSIDGQLKATLNKPGDTLKTYKELGAGQHVIRIERLTEAQGATGTFEGFFAPAGKMLAVQPYAHQIEFIGDSYTVGYGNTSPKRDCTENEIWATTDTSQAFGPLTAKHYKANYQINAISGRGIVRNYGGFAAPSLPEQYPYVLFDQKEPYADPSWHPQIMVIGLGTNDFTTPLHDGEKWKTRDELHADYEATYVKFVQDLRVKNPGAFFILMATDQVDGEIQAEVQKVMARLNEKGESRIAFLPMNGLAFTACNYHPSTADDQKVADSLIGFIDAHPELWQGK